MIINCISKLFLSYYNKKYEGDNVKRLIMIPLFVVLFLSACGTDDLKQTIAEQEEEIESLTQELEEVEQEQESIKEETNESQIELYMNMLNDIYSNYSEYDSFDKDTAMELYDKMMNHSTEPKEIWAAKEVMVAELNADNEDVYNDFFDEIIELEETFSSIEWE